MHETLCSGEAPLVKEEPTVSSNIYSVLDELKREKNILEDMTASLMSPTPEQALAENSEPCGMIPLAEMCLIQVKENNADLLHIKKSLGL